MTKEKLAEDREELATRLHELAYTVHSRRYNFQHSELVLLAGVLIERFHFVSEDRIKKLSESLQRDEWDDDEDVMFCWVCRTKPS